MPRLAYLHSQQVAKIAKSKKPGRYAVGGDNVKGLYLRIEGNSVGWVLRTKIGSDGRRVEIGLGTYIEGRDTEAKTPEWTRRNDQPEPAEKTLAEARKWAEEKRSEIRAGNDPVQAKRDAAVARIAAAKADKIAAVTFGECAEETIAIKTANAKNEKHKAQWRSTLETYCKDLWARPVAEIGKQDIVEVLKPIWQTKHETADRLRGRIEAVLDYAKGRDFRSGDNPAQWRGMLEPLLPEYKPKPKPRPSLPFRQMGEFMAEVRKRNSVSARAIEFLILTAARSGEVIGAKWSEIDLEAKEWNIPGDRMKQTKAHSVALSDAAVTLLRNLDRMVGNDHVFAGTSKGGCLSDMALNQFVRKLNGNPARYVDPHEKDEEGNPLPIVPHGFRSTFRDWAGDDTTHDREVIEHALAHRLKDKAEASYRRSTAMAKRAKLMQEWADYCATNTPKVVALENAA